MFCNAVMLSLLLRRLHRLESVLLLFDFICVFCFRFLALKGVLFQGESGDFISISGISSSDDSLLDLK